MFLVHLVFLFSADGHKCVLSWSAAGIVSSLIQTSRSPETSSSRTCDRPSRRRGCLFGFIHLFFYYFLVDLPLLCLHLHLNMNFPVCRGPWTAHFIKNRCLNLPFSVNPWSSWCICVSRADLESPDNLNKNKNMFPFAAPSFPSQRSPAVTKWTPLSLHDPLDSDPPRHPSSSTYHGSFCILFFPTTFFSLNISS